MTQIDNTIGYGNQIHELSQAFTAVINESFHKDADGKFIFDMPGFMSEGKRSDLPTLPVPLGSIDLEHLVKALGNENRRQAARAGLDSIQQKGEEQKTINEKQLKELGEQIKKMASQKTLGIFAKIFQVIGAIIGVIASAVTTAVGALTANPLLVAAGVLSAVMAVDSVMTTASDGKVGISAGIKALAVKCGASEETANKIAFGVQMALLAATVICSVGAGFTNSAGKMTETFANVSEKVINTVVWGQRVTSFASAGNSVVNGGLAIGNAVINKQVADSKATAKELEAILARLQESIQQEKDMVKALITLANDLDGQVRDIVADCTKTTATINTVAPSLA